MSFYFRASENKNLRNSERYSSYFDSRIIDNDRHDENNAYFNNDYYDSEKFISNKSDNNKYQIFDKEKYQEYRISNDIERERNKNDKRNIIREKYNEGRDYYKNKRYYNFDHCDYKTNTYNNYDRHRYHNYDDYDYFDHRESRSKRKRSYNEYENILPPYYNKNDLYTKKVKIMSNIKRSRKMEDQILESNIKVQKVITEISDSEIESLLKEKSLSKIAFIISKLLLEKRHQNISKVLNTYGKSNVERWLKKTAEIEKDGGLVTQDGKRRRTPGGVFFFLMQRDIDNNDV